MGILEILMESDIIEKSGKSISNFYKSPNDVKRLYSHMLNKLALEEDETLGD